MTVSTSGQNERPILIIGGGIAGLTLALALGERSIPCQVFEQSDEFSEIGAGLQLSPNAVRRLASLGVLAALEIDATRPDHIEIADALDGRALGRVPLGGDALARYGAPYLVTARADLQAILLTALQEMKSVNLKTGAKFISYRQDGAGITAEFEGGDEVEGALLIGADGIWSRVRQMIAPEAHPRTSGFIAWRALVPSSLAPKLFTNGATRVWLGPSTHLVAYRVKGGEAVNLVAVSPGGAPQKSWDEALPPELLFEEMRPWQGQIRAAVMEIEGWRAWPLMVMSPFEPWHKGRLMVMGDAAHAVVPFLAQGAALGIEDALLLRDLIDDNRDQLLSVPGLFQEARVQRARRVLKQSLLNGRIYHASGALRYLRNLALRSAPSSFLLSRYDWLYRH